MHTRRILLLYMLLACMLNAFSMRSTGEIDSLKLLRTTAGDAELWKIDRDLARIYSHEDIDSALHYLDLLKMHAEGKKDPDMFGHIDKIEGIIAMERHDYQAALASLQAALTHFRDAGNASETGWTAKRMGMAYFYLGNYDAAMERYLLALSTFEQEKIDLGIATTYNNLGAVCYMMGHFEMAIDYYTSASDLFKDLGLENQLFRTHNNMGIIYFSQEKYELALESYFKAVAILTEEENDNQLAGTYNNISLCYSSLEQPGTAMIYLRRALRLARSSENRYTEISARLNLGVLHSQSGLADSAMFYFEHCLAEADSLGLKQIEVECYNEMSQHFERFGDYRRALEMQRAYFELYDEIHHADSRDRIDNLMAGYEQKIKQQEIAQLRADQETQALINKVYALLIIISFIFLILLIYGYSGKRKSNRLLEEKNNQLSEVNTLLKESESSLKTMIEDNNKLFSIVAHDLRNPIAAVSGFSELLHENYQQLNEETRMDYLEQIIEGSTRTHDLLDNLLLWARSQMNAVKLNSKKVEIKQLVELSVIPVQIAIDHKKINLEVEFTDTFDLEVDPEMMKAVIRNLLTNAVKFSFPGGRIRLTCYRKDSKGCIKVEDSGIGMQPEVMKNLFTKSQNVTTPGTSGESGSGLGLVICKDYTEMNNGSISVESQPGKGSTFTICLPLAS